MSKQFSFVTWVKPLPTAIYSKIYWKTSSPPLGAFVKKCLEEDQRGTIQILIIIIYYYDDIFWHLLYASHK